MTALIKHTCLLIFLITIIHNPTYSQQPGYSLLYQSDNLSDFLVADECNPGAGTDCPCSIKDVGIKYNSTHIDVISNSQKTNTWVNAIAYKKYIDTFSVDIPVHLTEVIYSYKTRLPMLPSTDTSQHQNAGAVLQMMHYYNGSGTLWDTIKQSMEGAAQWSLNPWDTNYGKVFVYTTGLALVETGLKIIPDTNWHFFQLEIDFIDQRYIKFAFDTLEVNLSHVPLVFMDRSNWGDETAFGFTTESLALWPWENCSYISHWTQEFKEASVYFKYDSVYTNSQNISLKPEDILIYPVPAKDKLNITVPKNFVGKKISITDYSGRIVFTEIIQSKNLVINLKNLFKGSYSCFISDKSGIILSKSSFIKN